MGRMVGKARARARARQKHVIPVEVANAVSAGTRGAVMRVMTATATVMVMVMAAVVLGTNLPPLSCDGGPVQPSFDLFPSAAILLVRWRGR